MHVLLGATSIFAMGGMQRVVIDLANNLVTRGYKITLVGEADDNGEVLYPLRPEVTLINIRPLKETLNPGHIANKITCKIMTLTAAVTPWLTDSPLYQQAKWRSENTTNINAWRKLCTQIKPDVVLGVLPNTFTRLSIALKDTGIPLIINNHNNPWKDYSPERWDPNPVDLALRKAAPEISAANTVLLPDYKEYFSSQVQKRTYVIPNTVDPVAPGDLANPGQSEGLRTIVATGRLYPVKDHETLIRAFALLEPDFPDWQVKVFGEGQLRENLQNLIDSLNLGDKVFLCPHTDRVFDEYRASHILAMPSHFEGFPMSLTEAMAHGLPAVGFDDASGVNSLISHGKTGYLASGRDRVHSFSEHLRLLMFDNKKRKEMGDAAVALIAQYQPGRVYDLWESVLSEVVALSKSDA